MISSTRILGLDIGGTKCAVSVLDPEQGVVEVLRIPTTTKDETLGRLYQELASQSATCPVVVGISCGGPLDEVNGLICSPPNLPDWENVPIVAEVTECVGGPAFLMNDANAGTLAEWIDGAGQGAQHMAFLTCGTGLGAGLILNGQLYSGRSGQAGELGHLRLTPEGPVGYGKAGSAEGWCSGGGLAHMAEEVGPSLRETLNLPAGHPLTARHVGEAAAAGNPEALHLFETFGRRLGLTLSLLIDLLNLDTIVIGSLFARCEKWIRPAMEDCLRQESLPSSLQDCRICASQLGESIGNVAAIRAATYHLSMKKTGEGFEIAN